MTLPDLNPNDVSIIAYYNLINNTDANEINPEELAEHASISESTFYDNGITGTFEHENRDLKIRAKNDGWISAYLPQVSDTFETDQSTPDGLNGVYDIISHWHHDWARDYSELDVLSQTISDLLLELSNWETIEPGFSENDISSYAYEFPSATNISLFSDMRTSNGSDQHGFVVSDPTTIHYGSCTATGFGDIDIPNAYYEDTTIVNASSGHGENAYRCGAIDISELEKGTEKQTEIEIIDESPYSSGDGINLDVLLVWES